MASEVFQTFGRFAPPRDVANRSPIDSRLLMRTLNRCYDYDNDNDNDNDNECLTDFCLVTKPRQ